MKIRMYFFKYVLLFFTFCCAVIYQSCNDNDNDKKLKPTQIPEVITISVKNIEQNSAIVEGKVFGQLEFITRKGICYNTIGLPTIADLNRTNFSKTNDYEIELNGLVANTTYFVRAFAENEIGLAYGEELSFTTSEAQIPTVETGSIEHITQTQAVCHLSIIWNGGVDLSSKGVCWSLLPEPTIADSHVFNERIMQSELECLISNLIVDTTYYVRAFATNTAGTAYGEVKTFRTLERSGKKIYDIDGNEYLTVNFGEYFWLNQNLKTTRLNDGTPISLLTENNTWANTTQAGYCWLNNDTNNKQTLGALYNVYVINTNKVCPSGWHVPSDDEWLYLLNYDKGILFSDTVLVKMFPNNCGIRLYSGEFFGYFWPNEMSEWWSSSKVNNEYRGMSYGELFSHLSPNFGFSVQCVKDLD